MIHLVKEKMKMAPRGRDVVILHLEIEATFPNDGNRQEKSTTTMIDYGERNGVTAIARTVGLPIAIAAKLLLKDEWQLRGCHIPTQSGVFEPILNELRESGLSLKETVSTVE